MKWIQTHHSPDQIKVCQVYTADYFRSQTEVFSLVYREHKTGSLVMGVVAGQVKHTCFRGVSISTGARIETDTRFHLHENELYWFTADLSASTNPRTVLFTLYLLNVLLLYATSY